MITGQSEHDGRKTSRKERFFARRFATASLRLGPIGAAATGRFGASDALSPAIARARSWERYFGHGATPCLLAREPERRGRTAARLDTMQLVAACLLPQPARTGQSGRQPLLTGYATEGGSFPARAARSVETPIQEK